MSAAEQVTFRLAESVEGIGAKGQLVTLALTPADVHDPRELPTYLAGYKPFPYRADEISPVILTDNDEDKYRQFDEDDAFRAVVVKGSIQGAIPEVDPKTSLTPYKVVDRFVGSFISDITEQNATETLYRPRQAAMKRCQRAIQLDREVDVLGLLTTTGSWDTNNRVTLAAGSNWNGGADSDPIGDIQARIIASAQPVTDIWMNQEVGFEFLKHPLVRDHMRQMLGDNSVGGGVGMVADAGSQMVDFTIPGFPTFHIVASKVKDETTGNIGYVLGDDVLLTTRPPGTPTDGEEIATSYTFRRRGNAGVGYETREFRVDGRGPKGGTMVVVSMADIAVITGSNVGGLIKDCIQ